MTAVDDLRTAAKVLHKRHPKWPQLSNWLNRTANTWESGMSSVEQQDALHVARKVIKDAAMPDHVASMVRRGHQMEPDSPVHSATHRWTCSECGDAVLDSGTVVYGAATKRACGRRTRRDGGTR